MIRALILIVCFLVASLSVNGQNLVKINSNNGLSDITYIVSKSTESYSLDLIQSSVTLGVREYRLNAKDIFLEFEAAPPFLTIKCRTGRCIKEINAIEPTNRQAFPMLLTKNSLENDQILKSLKDLLESTISGKSEIKTISPSRAKTIALRKMDSGTYGINVKMNGKVTKEFILDSGASLISINKDVYNSLVRAGTIREYDLLGEVRSRIADGSVVKGQLINLRRVNINEFQFENVRCIVSGNMDAPLLLGQNILQAFGTIMIDYENNKLNIID